MCTVSVRVPFLSMYDDACIPRIIKKKKLYACISQTFLGGILISGISRRTVCFQKTQRPPELRRNVRLAFF